MIDQLGIAATGVTAAGDTLESRWEWDCSSGEKGRKRA